MHALLLSLTLLAPSERALIAAVDDYMGKTGETVLRDSVELNSGTLNSAGVIAVADYYDKLFTALGFATSRIDLTGVQRGCHLVAEHRGVAGAPRLLLIGHLDTVFEPQKDGVHYNKQGDRISGPGVSDMKGGNLVILAALSALARTGGLAPMNITVVLTGDEEAPGADADGSLTTSRAPLVAAAKAADLALAFEPTNGKQPAPIVARRGSAPWSLLVRAPSAHSSLIFSRDVGPGAVFPAATILARFYTELARDPLLTFNVGTLVAGSTVARTPGQEEVSATAAGKINIIAGTADVRGDIRTISSEQLEKTSQRMQTIVGEVLHDVNGRYSDSGKTTAELHFTTKYPSMPPTPGNLWLLEQLNGVSRELGFGSLQGADPLTQGAGDISFAASHVAAAIDGLGPDGFDYHLTTEHTSLRSLITAGKRAAVLLSRLQKQTLPKRS